jgi:hypothetical protein
MVAPPAQFSRQRLPQQVCPEGQNRTVLQLVVQQV